MAVAAILKSVKRP